MLHTKFVIFGIIGTLLVAAIYSSSTFFVFAEILTSCVGTSKTTTNCSTYDTETDEGHNYKCTKNKDGKTWSCDEIKAVKGDSIPHELNNALAAARVDIQNATKVPKNLGGLEDNVLGEGLKAVPPVDWTRRFPSDDSDIKGPSDLSGLNDEGGLTIGSEWPQIT